MKHFRPIGLALAATLLAGTAQAEVQKFVTSCNGKLCPFFHIALTPPDGWVIDQEATDKNKVQIMVPKGKTFGDAPALIYVQVFYHRDKQQTLANFAEIQQRTLARHGERRQDHRAARRRARERQARFSPFRL